MLLYDSLNLEINAYSFSGARLRRKEAESTAAVRLCCMRKAPLRGLLGFLFRKVMPKHQIGKARIQALFDLLLSQ